MIEHSTEITEIIAALKGVQGSVEGVVKDAKNPHFRSRYASLEAVIDSIRDALQQNNLVFTQAPGQYADSTISLTTMLLHGSGQWMRSTLQLPVTKNDPQQVGSAISYGRRYALQSILGLPAIDDDAETHRAVDRGLPGREPPPDRFEPRELVMDRAINGNGAVQLGDGEVTREAALRRKVEASALGRRLASAKTIDDIAAVMNNQAVISHVAGLHPDLRGALEAFAQERHRDISAASKNVAAADETAEQPFDGEARIVEVGEGYLLARSEQDIEEVRATWVEDNDRFSMSQRERVEDLDAKACRRIAERKPAATDPFSIPER